MRLVVSILSLFSLNILYRLSDYFLYPIIYYIVRYRRRLVRQNLAASFPEKSERQLLEIEKQYYRHLADLIVEIIYSYRVSGEEMLKRLNFINSEQAIKLARQYGGTILMLGHIGNWEWFAEVSHYMEQFGIESTHIYRKQKNKNIDRLMLDLRHRHGGNYSEKNFILRTMIHNRKNNVPQIYGMIADQKPSIRGEHYVTQFLNQTTPFLIGTEILAKKFSYPVFFCSISSPHRGYYEAEFHLIAETPQTTAEGEITEQYAKMLEKNIRGCPQLWLWTHNRWRRKK